MMKINTKINEIPKRSKLDITEVTMLVILRVTIVWSSHENNDTSYLRDTVFVQKRAYQIRPLTSDPLSVIRIDFVIKCRRVSRRARNRSNDSFVAKPLSRKNAPLRLFFSTSKKFRVLVVLVILVLRSPLRELLHYENENDR